MTLRHLSTPPARLDAPFNLFPITLIKPLKGAESGIRDNLKTFFELDYPNFEILFSIADPNDPVRPIVEKLIAAHPFIRARLIIGEVQVGPNPKINNMMLSYQQAKHDWLVISDSNVRVAPSYLKRLVAHLDPDVGILTSIVAGQNSNDVGGHLEATFLNTYYARGMLLAFATGTPVVIGKSMMFRKSTAERFGGLAVLARFLAEDHACGEAIRQLGYKTVLAADPIVQHIGSYSVSSFWARHIRWGRIRKIQSPIVFYVEPFLGGIASLILGSIAMHGLFGLSPAIFAAIHLSLWSFCDLLIMKRLGQRVEIKMPLVWFARELLAIPMWVHIASGNTVLWRGKRLSLRSGGILAANEV